MERNEWAYQERLLVQKKIEKFEQEKRWNEDVEKDPPAQVLTPDMVDYLNQKLTSKIARLFAFYGAEKYLKKIIKDKKLIIEDVVGLEHLKHLETGAIITSNHFSPMETFAIQYACVLGGIKKEKLYRVIREGNYTAFSGALGAMMRHCNTLPLSSNMETMKMFMRALEIVLKKGNLVVIYPEQSMWWNYKAPRPFKDGAFRFAVKNNVPVIPMFVTMKDSDIMGEDGFFVQVYTIHIFPPIYKNPKKTDKENIEFMKSKNFELCKKCYEKVYKTKYNLDI